MRRPAARVHPALGGRRLDLGRRRHVGVRGRVPRYIVGLYHQIWQNSDASIDALPLHTEAYVHWWKEGKCHPSFGNLITRVVAETAQHAGHAEVLREDLDGQGGRDRGAFGDEAAWTAYVARIQEAADPFRTRA